MSDTDPRENPILSALEKHWGHINSLTTDVRDMSMDVLILRAVIHGLLEHAKESGADVRPSCMAFRDLLPEEHRASFSGRLKTMYGIDLPF